ncbi:hypothetical protein PCK1_003079 [Pneumocystis canis]|nr:hypothetical protein PCK1_003079 [Pneumocystis canis]
MDSIILKLFNKPIFTIFIFYKLELISTNQKILKNNILHQKSINIILYYFPLIYLLKLFAINISSIHHNLLFYTHNDRNTYSFH